MKKLRDEGKKNPDIFRFTRFLLTSLNLPQYGYFDEITAIHCFVRDEIRFTRDVLSVETLQAPQITLKLRTGDCDDKSTLFASMVESIGHKTRFVTCGFSANAQKHVYTIVNIGNDWYPSETCAPLAFGIKQQAFKHEIVW